MTDEWTYKDKPQEIKAMPITIKHIIFIYNFSKKVMQIYCTLKHDVNIKANKNIK